jgi:penicillin-binding protein 1A
MSNSTENKDTSQKRQKSRKKSKKSGISFGIIKFIIAAVLTVTFTVMGFVCTYVKPSFENIPRINTGNINSLLSQNSVILDENGNLIETIQSSGLRTIVEYDDIDQDIKNAFLAIEDKTFFEHQGFNYIRLVGSVVQSVQSGGKIKGTSTLTQQLARNLYLPDSKSIRSMTRKLQEAYYTVELEKSLSKEEIFAAYLNTIFLGANSNGIQAAAETYFSKDASELDYIEAAMLAGIPAYPRGYAPLKTKNKADVTDEDIVIDDSGSVYTVVFNPSCVKRYQVVLKMMYQDNFITKEQYESAKDLDLTTKLKPGRANKGNITSYFSDMVQNDVIDVLTKELGYTTEEAKDMLYKSGLKIYSTIDINMQRKLENAFNNVNFNDFYGESTYAAVKKFQRNNKLGADGVIGKSTFLKLEELGVVDAEAFEKNTYRKGDTHPDILVIKKALSDLGYFNSNPYIPKVTITLDSNKNILSKNRSKLLLYNYDFIVNDKKQFIIPKSDYKFDASGNLVLLRNKRLNFYSHYKNDKLDYIQVTIKDSYKYDSETSDVIKKSSTVYQVSDLLKFTGRDVNIDHNFKSFDKDKNLVIDKEFINSNPKFFNSDGNGNLLIDNNNYTIDSKGTVQPQAAMVILDYRTGHLKAIVGGRNVYGQKIYNRANNPRQPGSSIKPIGVYLPAIDSRQYTAATVIDDSPMYLDENKNKRWPYNWYEYKEFKYWGLMTLREGIQWSNNVITVKLADMLGVDTCIEYLKKLGVSTIVETGPVNDINLSAVSLGGMSKGISPMEMTEAYGVLANEGVKSKTMTFTKITDNFGKVIYENKANKEKLFDKEVAYIMTDIMEYGAKYGLAKTAQIRPNNAGIPVAGKTGTTSNKYDAWFVGYTPYYVSAVWFGNDIQIPLSDGSSAAAKFWSKVMKDIHTGYEDKEFVRPEGIINLNVDSKSGKLPTELSYLDPRGSTVINEVFIKGTEPTEEDDVHVEVEVCAESGKLANLEYCPPTLIEKRVFIQRPEPYIPEENHGIILKDGQYDVPTEFCDIHNGENLTIAPAENSIDYSALPTTVKMLDGSKVTQKDVPVVLTNGVEYLIPRGTKVLQNNVLSLPDGSVLYPKDILNYGILANELN